MNAIRVDVAYALPDKQTVVTLDVPQGCTAREAVQRAGLVEPLAPCSLDAKLGIFGKVIDDPEHCVLADGDRVEIYRPLLMDPKEARRQRAEQSRRVTITPTPKD